MCIFSEIDAILMKCSAAWTPLKGNSEKAFERHPDAGFHQHLAIFSKSETYRHYRWQLRLGVHYSTFCQCMEKLVNDDVWKLLEGGNALYCVWGNRGVYSWTRRSRLCRRTRKEGKTLKEVALV